MLLDESIWQTLYVDYHPPTVERLWTHADGPEYVRCLVTASRALGTEWHLPLHS